MFEKLMRQVGCTFIVYGSMFAPMIAAADDGNPGVGAAVGFPIGAIVTGCILVSMSKQKTKATKADEYVKGSLNVHSRSDDYIRTTKTSRTINKN